MSSNCSKAADFIQICSGSCTFVGGVCYVKQIPKVCNGAIVVTSGDSQCIPEADSMCIYNYSGAAIYNTGRLRSVLPGYNPANTVLSAFDFTPTDLLRVWIPAIYEISGGTIVNSSGGSAPIISSGGSYTVCEESYNVADNPYWVVSWHEPAKLAGSAGSVEGIVCSKGIV